MSLDYDRIAGVAFTRGHPAATPAGRTFEGEDLASSRGLGPHSAGGFFVSSRMFRNDRKKSTVPLHKDASKGVASKAFAVPAVDPDPLIHPLMYFFVH